MIKPNWTVSAAEEIAEGYLASHPFLSVVWIASVIRKHCPFKPDIVHQEAQKAFHYNHNDDVD